MILYTCNVVPTMLLGWKRSRQILKCLNKIIHLIKDIYRLDLDLILEIEKKNNRKH